MRSFWVTSTIPHDPARIHPALTSFADECCRTLARLLAYVGVLALLAIAGIHLRNELLAGLASEPAAKAGWSAAGRSYPAFAVSQFDLPEKTEAYKILRHPEGGRKDVFRWTTQGEKPVAELEIYRPGGDAKAGWSAAVRSYPAFAVSQFDFPEKTEAYEILRHPEGEALRGRRAAIGCILNRLILLTAGNEPKLAELFARAELKHGSCAASATSAASVDWVTSAENPRLRGTL